MSPTNQSLSQVRLKATIIDATHLLRAGKGTSRLLPVFLISKLRTSSRRKKALSSIQEFNSVRDSLDLSTDWFSHNIPRWNSVFTKANIARNDSFSILEIGSWEGLSACFFLNYFPQAKLHAVDTWEGGDEHDGMQSVSMAEKRFDRNTSNYLSRVVKHKGTSDQFYESFNEDSFRVVYVDGSHRAEDVFNDASSGFTRLEVGGVMILDDLLWKFYKDNENNPAIGVNKFLSKHKDSLKIIDVGHQLYLQKIREI
jgi:predicted O-methyltransferase YrrM